MIKNIFIFIMPFLLSFLSTFILIKLLISSADYLKLIDYPDNRKKHEKGIPLIGGIAIFLPFIFFVGWDFPSVIPGTIFHPVYFIYNIPFFLSIIIIFIVGLYDDMKGLSAYKKIFFQIFASVLLVVGFGNIFILPISILDFGWNWNIYWSLNFFILICFIMGVANSINLIDGIDGLAGGLSIIISISFIILNKITGVNNEQIQLFVLLGSLVAFVIYNREPAKIFLGDSGSLFLGWIFVIVSLSPLLESRILPNSPSALIDFSIALPLLIIGVPAFDVLCVMLKRLFNSKKISLTNRIKRVFTADDFHIHHLFLSDGFSKKKTIIILCIMNIALSLSSILLYVYLDEISLMYSLVITFVVILCIRYSLSNNAL